MKTILRNVNISIKAIAVLTSLVISFGSLAQTSDLASSPSLQFTGKVKAETGEPLAGASVYIADLKTGVITDQEGNFRFANLSSGRHLVEVSYVGYSTYTAYVDLLENREQDFTLTRTVVENNEVVVTGVSTATQIRRTATPVMVIRKQDLARITATNLIDAISHKPGIAQLSTGPAISKPVIRGLGYNRVVVMNDHVRQEGQQWGDEHGIEIDEYSVSKVEILKGPASLMYGSDAMAGVINILTNVPAPVGTLRGSVTGNYQTNNKLRGIGANLSAFHESGFNWNVYGTYKAAADYKNRYDGPVYNSKFNEANFGGYVGLNGNWGYSHLLFSQFHQHTGIVEGERDANGNFLKALPNGNETVAADADFNSVEPQIPRQEINHLKLTSDNNFVLGRAKLALVLGYQRNARMEFGNPDDPKEKELYFDLNTFTYSAAYHFRETGKWRTAIGLNGMAQENKNKGAELLIPEYGLFDMGGFVYTQYSLDKLTLSGGLRMDHRSIDSREFKEGLDTRFAAFKRNFSNLSGSIGASYLFSPDWTLKLNIARGFRAPSLPELASNGTHEGTNRYEYGDADLKSETSLQGDAGLEWNTEHLSFSASLFYNSIDHFIYYRKLSAAGGGDSTVESDGDQIPAFKFSQQNAILSGAEFTLDIHPHPLDWLHIENSLSLVRGRFRDAVEGSRNIPFVPAGRLVSEVRADLLKKGKLLRNAFVKIELDQTFRQNNPFTAYNTETATDGYGLVNAGVGTDYINRNGKTIFSLSVSVLNLGDKAYQNHLSRLKYAAENQRTGRMGVFNMGRNFSIRLNIPLETSLGKG